MTPPAIDIVLACDWQGIYVNGALKAEGHTLKFYDVLEALGLSYTRHETLSEDNLPATLADLEG